MIPFYRNCKGTQGTGMTSDFRCDHFGYIASFAVKSDLQLTICSNYKNRLGNNIDLLLADRMHVQMAPGIYREQSYPARLMACLVFGNRLPVRLCKNRATGFGCAR